MPEKSRPALVIGNGPSVDQLRPGHLRHFETYGCNHIHRKFAEWGRAVDNVVITDSNRIAEIGEAYKDFSGRLYVGDQRYFAPPIARIQSLLGRPFIPLRQLARRRFPINALTRRIRWSPLLFNFVFDKSRASFVLDAGINFGASVVISAIQIATINGARQILLTGVDSHYETPKAYFKGAEAGINYVNPAFTKNPRFYMEPILVIMQIYLESLGVELLDCTPGGKLRFIGKGRLLDDPPGFESIRAW